MADTGDPGQDRNSAVKRVGGEGNQNQINEANQREDQNSEANGVVGGQRNENQNQINEANQKLRRSLEKRIEKKEEQTLKMEASVFQLANYYFVFQGVILTAIIKGSSSSLKCQLVWLLLSMSTIGAILNFGTLVIIADKYKEALDQLDEDSLILYRHLYPTAFEARHQEHKKKKARRHAILVASMTLFLLFAVLNIVGTWIIPCQT